ncbi:permease of the major facilitator superfamily [Pediococcus damnosus]|uniref:Permease of the major facilitator superfamily n=1 Tax=Pediococcus damnosus TaxID=51663 RepID=A0A0R2HLF6_9LACO|nr:MFS transporter [Pediococcus damnosus]AMV63011.1 permease of the major facilitator superfamily [Pediococcus damnosus]AMV67102.1 permease of the major facilitator superfamily [Pediococcus damnosus]AMV69296.1 permease of the major facilitator superfamily [Pediococcus damnosus]KRN53795.1 permease, major facilitator superfamily [Pediococcus damnosus]PIO81122.1 MFS transporter [Pediococcus damnosus]
MNKFKLSAQTIKLLIIKFTGTFGSGMLSFAIGLYILHRTGSALGMGISLITGPLVSLILTPFVGFIVDTFNHRKIMIMAQITTSLGLLLFGFVFRLWPAQYYPELIGLIIILQITDNFLGTTLTASLVQLFDSDELQRVNSLNQSISSLASFLAPVVGAFVYTLVSIDSFAFIEIGFEVIALVTIAFLHFSKPIPNSTPEIKKTGSSETVWQNFRTGFQYLRNQHLMSLLIVSAAAINFFFSALNVGQPYLLVTTLKLSNTQYGVTDSAFAVGMFLGGILLSLLKLKHHPIIISYLNIAFLSFILIATGVPEVLGWSSSLNTLYFIGLNVLNGGILVFINTPMSTYMQQLIPQHMQGRIFSLDSTISMLLMPVGTLIFGFLFDHVAALPVFLLTGIALLVFTISILTLMRKQKLLDLPENTVEQEIKE